MVVRYVLRNCQNKRFWKHKQERWYPFTTEVNDAKWFGTWEAAERHRVTREDPAKWEVVHVEVAMAGEKMVVPPPAPSLDLASTVVCENRAESLEAFLTQLYPELSWMGVRNWVQAIDDHVANLVQEEAHQ
jgi:hypothetical protein